MTDRPDSARRGRTAPPRRARAAIQSSHRPAGQPRPWQQVSTLRLETFSDGVFAIAVTLLALQLHPPNLTGVTTAGAVLHALGQQQRSARVVVSPEGRTSMEEVGCHL
jgi:hypothetical protein